MLCNYDGVIGLHLLPSARSLLFGYYKKNRPQKGSYLVLLFSLAFSSSLSFAETIEIEYCLVAFQILLLYNCPVLMCSSQCQADPLWHGESACVREREGEWERERYIREMESINEWGTLRLRKRGSKGERY